MIYAVLLQNSRNKNQNKDFIDKGALFCEAYSLNPFLATLVALHFTPVTKTLGRVSTSELRGLRACLVLGKLSPGPNLPRTSVNIWHHQCNIINNIPVIWDDPFLGPNYPEPNCPRAHCPGPEAQLSTQKNGHLGPGAQLSALEN